MLICKVILSLVAITTIAFGQDNPVLTCNPSHDHLDPSSHRFISSCPESMYCTPQPQANPNTSLSRPQQQILHQVDSSRDPKQAPISNFGNETTHISDDGEVGGGGGGGSQNGGVCVDRACRRDEFPFGFPSGSSLPPLCSSTGGRPTYCPDNGSGCRAVLSPGSPCELVRDEQCAAPPRGSSSWVDNTGALCLNRICTYVNATLANPCVVENTTYSYPSALSHSLYTLSVIRNNCLPELYCDPTSLSCLKAKLVSEPCSADFECIMGTCDQGTCINGFDTPYVVTPRQWAILISVIFIALVMTMVTLILVHRRHRYRIFRELREYYTEQISLRRAIIALHTAAANGELDMGEDEGISVRKGYLRNGVY